MRKLLEKIKNLFQKHECTNFTVHTHLHLLECKECGSVEFFQPNNQILKNEF